MILLSFSGKKETTLAFRKAEDFLDQLKMPFWHPGGAGEGNFHELKMISFSPSQWWQWYRLFATPDLHGSTMFYYLTPPWKSSRRKNVGKPMKKCRTCVGNVAGEGAI